MQGLERLGDIGQCGGLQMRVQIREDGIQRLVQHGQDGVSAFRFGVSATRTFHLRHAWLRTSIARLQPHKKRGRVLAFLRERDRLQLLGQHSQQQERGQRRERHVRHKQILDRVAPVLRRAEDDERAQGDTQQSQDGQVRMLLRRQ